jgi:CIC family chloride channel protein
MSRPAAGDHDYVNAPQNGRCAPGYQHGGGSMCVPQRLREVASANFTVVREDEVVINVIHRMYRREASMALVVHATGKPRARDLVGVISKEHVADSVARSTEVYPIGAE